VLGDVVICPAVARRNAPEHAGTYEDELALLVVHGLLHLLGMDHTDDEEAEAMEDREQVLLTKFHRPPIPEQSATPEAATDPEPAPESAEASPGEVATTPEPGREPASAGEAPPAEPGTDAPTAHPPS
jgi:hypothetical protein